jgi:5-oxoprolinase (ATP-hydrolysing)
MGGTSTDVVRIEPLPNSFEYQHETAKAGVRIMTPMLAVETVAAGGGSICAFDGQKLTVGPHSAGADPGPACYGRGGPLTITDVNLYLGRVSATHFPFALDRAVVEQKLAVLSETIRAATSSVLTSAQLADGFVEIANAHMSAAIRKVSIAKGYDPAEYTLNTFGGAGGQQACAIAEALGIPRVLCSPYAGVLSALGIGTAPTKRVHEQSANTALGEKSLDECKHSAERIAGELLQEIRTEGVDSTWSIEIKHTLDVCYAGQSTLLTVEADSAQAIRVEFEHLHRQLYGYIHAGRDMEIRVIRVEVSATSATCLTSKFLQGSSSKASPNATKDETLAIDLPAASEHMMIIGGECRQVPLFTREMLTSGMNIPGPAIIMEETSTIIVNSGWRASVLDGSEILLEQITKLPDYQITKSRIDGSPSPIRLELFNNQFAAIAEQMGVTLRRTALSTNVKERLDFSCAVFTAGGELVVNAPHIPVHLGGMSECVKCLIADVGGFEPGDVYITNDPFRGGSHLNDITVITPVFVPLEKKPDTSPPRHITTSPGRMGEATLPHCHITTLPNFFVASRAHHAEIGGMRPGSMPPESRNLAEEGVLIRAFRWMQDGWARQDELRELLASPPFPSRSPEDNLADIAAQVAANQTGARALLAMVSRHGIEVVQAYMAHIQAAAMNKMRAALRKLGDGVYRFEERMDDGTTIRLAVTIREGTARFDFTGTDPVHPGNFNANRAIVTSAVLYCLRCLIDDDIPLNAGVLAPVEIILPRCFLNPNGASDARKCPAVAAGNVETSQRIVDTIFGALGLVAASQGTMNNLLMGNDRFGYYETVCGGAGAGPDFHGADAVHTNMTNTRLTDPEVLESRYPVRLHRFQIRKNSGGAGRFRGGCGVVREFEFLEPLDVSIISQRRHTAPYGLAGGSPGLPGKNTFIRAAVPAIDNATILPPIASVSVRAGDRLIMETPGGGGWGQDPPFPLGEGRGEGQP